MEYQKIELSLLTLNDYPDLKDVMISAYPMMPELYWKERHIQALTNIFPEGQIAVKVDGHFAGCALSIIINYNDFEEQHTYKEITGNMTFNTHTYKGDILYGVDIFVKPEYRGLRLGRRMYDYRKELCEKLNLKAIVFGGRIPNYHKYLDKLTPKGYIDKVKTKEIHDPVLNFQMSNDFYPIRILKGYLEGDKASNEYAVLLRWENIYFERKSNNPVLKITDVRLGIVQWQMRPYKNLSELMEHVEYFVDALSGYKSDFALFPELFNAPLMAEYNHLSEAEAIKKLADYTPQIITEFSKLAVSYNINIISGSMPELVNNRLHNAGYLCQRNGKIDRYEKIHVTPDEERVWALLGGNSVTTFDTDCGKIGILICYDVEFPELSRLLAEEGMEILFVPFLTDTQNSYYRVRYCAQARAIENECFVAIAGSVGNLPKVHNMDIQFAHSMVLTPCDYPFPTNGIKAETTPNSEMVLIADIDLNLLKGLHNQGSVKNLKNRRLDLYKLSRC